MTKFIGAIDQGTTSTRFMVFDRNGIVVSVHQKPHEQIFPKAGWVEHNPLEILENTQEIIQVALDKAKLSVSDLAAVGVTNQRETTVVWDKTTGAPIHDAIVWQDTRTAEMCARLAKSGGQNRFRAKTGLPLATYFSAPKIAWILDHIKGARARAEKGEILFGTIDTWLIWNLTGAHITDVTNASRTMLMNLKSLDYDAELLRAFRIPRAMLPSIRSSSEIYATGKGVLEGIPIAGDLGDQHAALFGQACYSPGEAKNTYGTGCFMLMNTGAKPIPSKNGLLTTLGYKIGKAPAVYALEGSIAIAGALVQWLRDNLELVKTSNEIESLASSVSDNGGIYFVPAFSGLYAPYWKDNARGAIVGMTRYINKGHLARATLEATAFQTREVLDAMNKDSGVKLKSLKVDGGMVVNETLMQFQSDVLGAPVVRPKVAETTSLGAAYAAGLAVGYWKSFGELRANWSIDKEWKPKMKAAARESLYRGWKKAVTRTFDWVD
jgi:glycerol kinase